MLNLGPNQQNPSKTPRYNGQIPWHQVVRFRGVPLYPLGQHAVMEQLLLNH